MRVLKSSARGSFVLGAWNAMNEKATPGDIERAQQDKAIAHNLGRMRHKIMVLSGKGGVGKSTVSAYLSILLSKEGYRVGLLDVDLHGPSIPRLLNVRGGLDFPEEGEENPVEPCRFSDNLSVVSLEMVVGREDLAVIWRGPMKISAIRQFLSDINWGDLDYFIVDSPPGTGDEPLSIAQTIPDTKALIVTTPQEISLADVRKTIDFCRQADLEIVGVVENMSGLICPGCGGRIDLFGSGGASEMARQLSVPFLGSIPLSPRMVDMGDKGTLELLTRSQDSEINTAYREIMSGLSQRGGK